MSVKLRSVTDPLAGYEVECPACGEEYVIHGSYPHFCPECAAALETEDDS